MQPVENRQASNSASMLKTLKSRLDKCIIANDPLGSPLNRLKRIKLVSGRSVPKMRAVLHNRSNLRLIKFKQLFRREVLSNPCEDSQLFCSQLSFCFDVWPKIESRCQRQEDQDGQLSARIHPGELEQG
ncbi:hypothetical protein PYW08_005497 [Mythimna loreyi]|uniref:Uncharacterized protein n=1 Tax=Mythimna loreyi TaxID=667449 RepID=A0ACC2QLU7_9NEOP|nr:hypothetical protein PYW08_005497 [Mythimna loreyi]